MYHMGLQGFTGGSKELQGVSRGYKGIQVFQSRIENRTFFQLSFFSTEYDVLESSDFH